MATVNNVWTANVAKQSGDTEIFSHYFALSRALKKAGWKVLATGDSTGSKVVSDDPALDQWGSGAATGSSGSSASIATATLGRATVTGLSGITSADKGRFLSITGGASAANNHYHQIEEVLSATSVRIDARRAAFTPGNDANNGSLSWAIYDPTGDSQPFLSTTLAWILLRGPSMLRVPITSAPTPGTTYDFIVGETVVQSSTGAEGEFRGYVYSGGSGYLVVAPQLRGTGSGVFGWQTGNTITGSASGATASHSGTAAAFTQQVVIHKAANYTNGSLFVQCVDKVAETASDFQTLASTAGCTSSVAPGQGGTSNGFPSIGYLLAGTNTVTTGSAWNGQSTTQIMGNAQVIAIDALEEQGYSAVGSWAVFSAANDYMSGCTGTFLCFVDEAEPGELDPYVGFCSAAGVAWAASPRTGCLATTVPPDLFSSGRVTNATAGVTNTFLKGWRGRGSGGSTDAYVSMEFIFPFGNQTGGIFLAATTTVNFGVTNQATTKVVHPVRVGSTQSAQKIFKGTFRNLVIVKGANRFGTYDSKQYLGLSTADSPMLWHPWDGTTFAVGG